MSTKRQPILQKALSQSEIKDLWKKQSNGVISKSRDELISKLRFFCKQKNIQYHVEFIFTTERKFRFDFAIPSQKIAIEYEGIMNRKGDGNSRHTNIHGYTRDATKYNLATILGWRVLRYTYLNKDQLFNDLEKILCLPRN